MTKALVTGGAGFIGSHVVDRLVSEGKEVVVFDNLSAGKREYVNEKALLVEGNMLEKEQIERALKEHGIEEVWHLAANPEVRISESNVHFTQNAVTTFNLLEAMRAQEVKRIFFTSTSTVYGRAEKIPTPENYGPMKPISVYGASKLAAEAMIMSYAHTYGFRAQIFRFANIIGGRSGHGIIPDFIKKLRKDSQKLEILGDGKQCKSYLHVSECVDAMMHTAAQQKEELEIYNIGSEDKITVDEIACIIEEEMNVKPEHAYTGGEQGWVGDVPVMLLSIEKLKSAGWSSKLSSAEAIRKTVKESLE